MKYSKLCLLLDNSNEPLIDKICMILSNRIDYGSEKGGMISVSEFRNVATDLIKYLKLNQ